MRTRPYTSGSVADSEGGVRAYLHIARLKKIAASIDVHCQHAPALLAAAEAIEQLCKRNKQLGRQVGRAMQGRLKTVKGASVMRTNPQASEIIADLAGDRPVIVYLNRDRSRFRITASTKIPRTAQIIGRFDESTDYRVIAQKVEEARAA